MCGFKHTSSSTGLQVAFCMGEGGGEGGRTENLPVPKSLQYTGLIYTVAKYCAVAQYLNNTDYTAE